MQFLFKAFNLNLFNKYTAFDAVTQYVLWLKSQTILFQEITEKIACTPTHTLNMDYSFIVSHKQGIWMQLSAWNIKEGKKIRI